MALTPEVARRLWESLPLPVEEGLAPVELRRIESALGFTFNPDHWVLLQAGLPLGGRWPDWRNPDGLRERLAEPIEGVLFDVEENDFWWPAWGPRPVKLIDALAQARRALRGVPTLVPVYGHRYLAALPEPGLPVLSVVQTDVVVYGSDIADYLSREFGSTEGRGPGQANMSRETGLAEEAGTGSVRAVPFWSDLI